MSLYIGVDLGGTNVRVAKVDEKGQILEDIKEPSYANEGPKVVLDHIVDMIKRITDYKECAGIGLGVPGPVDVVNGCMTISTNIKGFSGYPVVSTLKEALDMPIFMDNDANVAGLAEAMLGAGKGLPIVYYITHSTGIGGALIIDQKTISGRRGYAGEIANIIVDRDRKKYNYLNVGAIENEAAGPAIARKGQEILGTETTKDVFDLYKKGDPKAVKIIDDMAYDFAQMMSAIACVVDPYIFVIGGGVAQNNSECYFDRIRNYYRSMVHEKLQDVQIVNAILPEPGVVGAAMLVKSAGL